MDGDGTLSYEELVMTSIGRKISAKEERLWTAFSKVDLNHDGKDDMVTLNQFDISVLLANGERFCVGGDVQTFAGALDPGAFVGGAGTRQAGEPDDRVAGAGS